MLLIRSRWLCTTTFAICTPSRSGGRRSSGGGRRRLRRRLLRCRRSVSTVVLAVGQLVLSLRRSRLGSVSLLLRLCNCCLRSRTLLLRFSNRHLRSRTLLARLFETPLHLLDRLLRRAPFFLFRAEALPRLKLGFLHALELLAERSDLLRLARFHCLQLGCGRGRLRARNRRRSLSTCHRRRCRRRRLQLGLRCRRLGLRCRRLGLRCRRRRLGRLLRIAQLLLRVEHLILLLRVRGSQLRELRGVRRPQFIHRLGSPILRLLHLLVGRRRERGLFDHGGDLGGGMRGACDDVCEE